MPDGSDLWNRSTTVSRSSTISSLAALKTNNASFAGAMMVTLSGTPE